MTADDEEIVELVRGFVPPPIDNPGLAND
jgi:hypothetical protein